LSSGEALRGPVLKELLVEGVRRANGEVYRCKKDMGTTLTAVVSVGVQAYVASVGDSRRTCIVLAMDWRN
jgi:serine/threonine protein phosphatase PrpC